MKKFTDKEDQLISGIMKDLEMENPSEGFTDRVMQRIQTQTDFYLVNSSPLISKTAWIGIAVCFALLLAVIFMGSERQVPAETGWLTEILSSISFPAMHLSFAGLFSWVKPYHPALFWIITSIGGLTILAFLQQLMETVSIHRFNLL